MKRIVNTELIFFKNHPGGLSNDKDPSSDRHPPGLELHGGDEHGVRATPVLHEQHGEGAVGRPGRRILGKLLLRRSYLVSNLYFVNKSKKATLFYKHKIIYIIYQMAQLFGTL